MRISKKRIAGVAALLVFLSCVLCLSLRANTDDIKQSENVNGERKNNKYITVPDEYKSISEAIGHAKEGDTVFVKEGSYEESVRLKNGVNLIGEDKNKVTIFRKTTSQEHVLLADCNNTLVKGLTIEHIGQDLAEKRAVGIYLIKSSARIEDCRVRNIAGNGLVARDGGQPVIKNCLFESNGLQGIYLYSCQAHVEYNRCNENKNGIVISQKANCTLKSNQCCRNEECGIYICGGATCTAESNICNENGHSGITLYEPNTTGMLARNEAGKNQLNGIKFTDGASGIAERNICRFNKINGIGVSGNWSSVTLRENTCSDNFQNGILLGTRQTTVAEKNVCVDNRYAGISIYAYASLAKLSGNICSRNKTDGIWFGLYAGGEAKDNVCTENERNGIYITSVWSAPKLINNNCQNNKGQALCIEPGDFGNARLMFVEEKFDELEKIASQLRLQNPRSTDSGFQLSGYYNSICLFWEDYKPPLEQSMLKLAEKWIEQKPDSVTPRIVKAKLLSGSGWRARGKGYAYTVTEQGWHAFESEHKKAWDVLASAEKLNNKDPELYATRLDFCRALGKSRRDINDIFYKGIEVSKNYYPLYQQMGQILLPRWFGKRGELEAFACKAVDITAPDEGESLYAVIAEVTIPYLGENVEQFLEYGFSYDRLKTAYRDLLKRCPGSNYHMNSFCLIASLYKDRKTAEELFGKIGDNWNWDVWHYQRVFDKYRNWAYTKDSKD